MKISEIITDKYKLRIPPTVYYDLLADVQELEEQEPKFIAKSDGTIEQIKNCNDCLFKKEWEKIGKLISVVLKKQTEQEPTTKNDSSGLEKNSKKLEKDFDKMDCISRADAIKAMQDKAKKLTNEDIINGLCGAVAVLFDLPSVTPQEPCDKCEVGNPCLYCKHEFEPQEGR